MLTITESTSPYAHDLSGFAKGLEPRDFRACPPGYLGDFAATMPDSLLIDEAQWDELIDQQEQTKSSLEHLLRDRKVDSLDQNGQGYCWAYSTTCAVMCVQLVQNTFTAPLSGHMIGCLVKGYRDQGGWNAQSLAFARANGIATVNTWPAKSMNRSNDNAAMREEAKKSIVTEWWDLDDRGDKVRRQLGSLLLQNIPVMVDFAWWGHSVCAVRLVKRNPFTIRIRNSWTNSWGDYGFGDLTGSRAIPNGAAAPRVTRIAA